MCVRDFPGVLEKIKIEKIRNPNNIKNIGWPFRYEASGAFQYSVSEKYILYFDPDATKPSR